MLHDVLRETGKSIWKEIGEDTLKKATATLVSESIKAVVEIWKKRQMRQDDYEFSEWKKRREEADKKVGEGEAEADEVEVGDPSESEPTKAAS